MPFDESHLSMAQLSRTPATTITRDYVDQGGRADGSGWAEASCRAWFDQPSEPAAGATSDDSTPLSAAAHQRDADKGVRRFWSMTAILSRSLQCTGTTANKRTVSPIPFPLLRLEHGDKIPKLGQEEVVKRHTKLRSDHMAELDNTASHGNGDGNGDGKGDGDGNGDLDGDQDVGTGDAASAITRADAPASQIVIGGVELEGYVLVVVFDYASRTA